MTTPELSERWKGLSISTFGGNPVSCAAALATIEVIEEEGLVARTAELGKRTFARLDELAERHPTIGEVRGKGLMIGIEIVTDRESRTPGTAQIGRLMEETRQRGLLIGKGGLYGNSVRLAPPLNVDETDLDRAIEIFDEALSAVEAG